MTKKPVIYLAFLLTYLIVLPGRLYAQPFKGNVKSVVIFYYSLNVPTNVWEHKYMSTYNKQGQLTAEYIYGLREKRDSVNMGLAYVYNADGKRISTTDSKSSRVISQTEFNYNKQHNLVETTSIGSRPMLVKTLEIYNNKGIIDTVLQYDVAGKLHRKLIKHNNDKGNIMQQEIYEYGVLDHTEIIKYDNNHNILEDIRTKANGIRDSHETYQYDNNGNELMQLDSNVMYIGGLLMKKISDKIYSRTFRYDKFDKSGNWIQQSYLMGDQFVLYSKREIEYY